MCYLKSYHSWGCHLRGLLKTYWTKISHKFNLQNKKIKQISFHAYTVNSSCILDMRMDASEASRVFFCLLLLLVFFLAVGLPWNDTWSIAKSWPSLQWMQSATFSSQSRLDRIASMSAYVQPGFLTWQDLSNERCLGFVFIASLIFWPRRPPFSLSAVKIRTGQTTFERQWCKHSLSNH